MLIPVSAKSLGKPFVFASQEDPFEDLLFVYEAIQADPFVLRVDYLDLIKLKNHLQQMNALVIQFLDCDCMFEPLGSPESFVKFTIMLQHLHYFINLFIQRVDSLHFLNRFGLTSFQSFLIHGLFLDLKDSDSMLLLASSLLTSLPNEQLDLDQFLIQQSILLSDVLLQMFVLQCKQQYLA